MGAFLVTYTFELCAFLAMSVVSVVLDLTLGQVATFGHILVIVMTFGLAVFLAENYSDYFEDPNTTWITGISLEEGCNTAYFKSCIYRQLIYRASLALAAVFAFLLPLSYFSNYVYRKMWMIKFAAVIGVFVSLFWVENSNLESWAATARVLSFVYLLIQGLLFIDFSHDMHDLVLKYASAESFYFYHVLYILLSVGALACAVTGVVVMFTGGYTECKTGMAFVVVTLVMGVLCALVSMLDCVNRGMLTPCLLFAYNAFMCWYALLSNPNERCNPSANSLHEQHTALGVICSVSLVVMLYCAVNGSRILSVFDPSGEGVLASYQYTPVQRSQLLVELTGGDSSVSSSSMDESIGLTNSNQTQTRESQAVADSSKEHVFFCSLMLLFSAYGAMALTTWGKGNGEPPGGSGPGAEACVESQWLLIVSQWAVMLFYVKVLHTAYLVENK